MTSQAYDQTKINEAVKARPFPNMLNPFRDNYPLAEGGIQENANDLLEQIGTLTDFIGAFDGAAVAVAELAKTHGPKLINAVFPDFDRLSGSVNAVPKSLNDRLVRLQQHRLSVIEWQKLSREEQEHQRDILVQLDYLWSVIYKTGLRASTTRFVQTVMPTSLIATNIEDLKKNIEAEFTPLWEALQKPCYLANFFQYNRPDYLDEKFTLAQLFVQPTETGAIEAMGRNVCGNG